ncbi:MAG: hypothetical protein O2782_18220 [bacterium]|nr:hypothetical protein [bacterium]
MDPRPKTLTRSDITDAIVEWRATPADYRDPPTLRSLAQKLGITPNGNWYNLANRAEVARQASAASACVVLPYLPSILEVLVSKALAGNVRAADAVLRHVREMTRDVPSSIQPPTDLRAHLEHVAAIAGQLAQVGKPESARLEVRSIPPSRRLASHV